MRLDRRAVTTIIVARIEEGAKESWDDRPVQVRSG
jgi:hypothetical protein